MIEKIIKDKQNEINSELKTLVKRYTLRVILFQSILMLLILEVILFSIYKNGYYYYMLVPTTIICFVTWMFALLPSLQMQGLSTGIASAFIVLLVLPVLAPVITVIILNRKLKTKGFSFYSSDIKMTEFDEEKKRIEEEYVRKDD